MNNNEGNSHREKKDEECETIEKKQQRGKKYNIISPVNNDRTKQGVDEESTGTPSALLRRLPLTRHKAGMDKVDKEHVNAVILAKSSGSKYMKKQEERNRQTMKKLAAMKTKWNKANKSDRLVSKKAADSHLRFLEQRKDYSRVFVHVDLDAFYASVEERDNPKLRSVPFGVGGMSMLSTANYIARKFGVRSAMPGYIAKELCPQLRFIRGRMEEYKRTSTKFKAVLAEYDSNFSSHGLDEACLELTQQVTNYMDNHLGVTKEGAVHIIVEEMRKKIHDKTGVTSSAGISCVRRLSKVGSDMNKPNGQFCIGLNEVATTTFLMDLPLRKLPGIGGVTDSILRGLRVEFCKDVFGNLPMLHYLFTPKTFNHLLCLALGVPSSLEQTAYKRKSISCERTFTATANPGELLVKLNRITAKLCSQAKDKELLGRCITVKLKTSSYEVRQHSRSLRSGTNDESIVWPVVKLLVEEELVTTPTSMRLLGVKLSCLQDASSNRNTIDKYFKLKGKTDQPTSERSSTATSCVTVKGGMELHDDSETSNKSSFTSCENIIQRCDTNLDNATTTSVQDKKDGGVKLVEHEDDNKNEQDNDGDDNDDDDENQEFLGASQAVEDDIQMMLVESGDELDVDDKQHEQYDGNEDETGGFEEFDMVEEESDGRNGEEDEDQRGLHCVEDFGCGRDSQTSFVLKTDGVMSMEEAPFSCKQSLKMVSSNRIPTTQLKKRPKRGNEQYSTITDTITTTVSMPVQPSHHTYLVSDSPSPQGLPSTTIAVSEKHSKMKGQARGKIKGKKGLPKRHISSKSNPVADIPIAAGKRKSSDILMGFLSKCGDSKYHAKAHQEQTSVEGTCRCPVCGRDLSNCNNLQQNQHIDMCLNTPLVSSLSTATH
eukprot:m.50912 g.50912  ORF g.50912 m.50912 type:complete len:884 (-) comp10918_c0_seq4:1499-4150(-)